MNKVSCNTFWIKLYLSGPEEVIKQTCRSFCKEVGLCVTVTPTTFIYTGGEEFGCEVGLLVYPKYPGTKYDLFKTAEELALLLKDATYQDSVLLVSPYDTTLYTDRKIPS